MTPFQSKFVDVCAPAAIYDNASLTANVIDTKGYRRARIVVYIGATDIAVAALKVQEADAASDATTLTSGADIVGTRAGTDANDTGSTSTLPSATADNTFVVFEIDLRGRKRYLQPVVTAGNGSSGTYAAVWAELFDGEVTPTTASQKGAGQLFRVPVL